MKYNVIFGLLCFCQVVVAQVGIGTLEPQTDLDVNGSLLIQNTLQTHNPLPATSINDENFKLLGRRTDSEPVGEITVLNVKELNVAPINVITYEFTNFNKDNLTDVNLQYDADKYIVAVSNFRYIGDPVRRRSVNGKNSLGAFVTNAFIGTNNQWHIEIRNLFLDLANNQNLKYEVTLIIYDKSYFRHLELIEVNMGSVSTGSAPMPDF